jgi:hypothetical protein
VPHHKTPSLPPVYSVVPSVDSDMQCTAGRKQYDGEWTTQQTVARTTLWQCSESRFQQDRSKCTTVATV